MKEKNMRCPFRKDENGDFAPCYKDECMAYNEYDTPIVTYGEDGKPNGAGKTVHVVTCKLATNYGFACPL